jgi:TatA/E family protein of Tat protein translocase
LPPDALQSPSVTRLASHFIARNNKAFDCRKVGQLVFALILESFGSTELLFILIIALIFFGPRKLPQLSRSLGKSLAEFRRASEDFKQTWEREVALESGRSDNAPYSEERSILESNTSTVEVQQPSVAPIPAEHVMPRQSSFAEPYDAQTVSEPANQTPGDEPLTKRDWL